MNNGTQQQSEIQTLQTILERLSEVDEEARDSDSPDGLNLLRLG